MVVLVTLDAAYSWVGHDCWAGVWTGTRSKIATATRRKRVYGTDGSVVGREEGKKMSILGSVQRKNKINGFRTGVRRGIGERWLSGSCQSRTFQAQGAIVRWGVSVKGGGREWWKGAPNFDFPQLPTSLLHPSQSRCSIP